VEDIQRTHILEALATIVAERGVSGLTLADALARANVTRRVFYGLFDDLETALMAAFELGVRRAGDRIAPAYSEQARWRDAIRPALAELLRFLDDEPALGRLCVVHSLSGGPALLRRRAEVQTTLWRVVDRGRGEGVASRVDPPAVIAEGVVGAVLTVVQTRLLAQDDEPPDRRPVIELFGSLMSLITLPYLGYGASQRELGRPAPAPRSAGGRMPEGYGGEYHGVRLTYRTSRVLAAIAQYPGASNREIAERAGIVDQGQVSKLLARLRGGGVIENLTEGTARGAPNSWRLTDLGEHVEQGAAGRYESVATLSETDDEEGPSLPSARGGAAG
jgi:AcrR family transcriptional regulator